MTEPGAAVPDDAGFRWQALFQRTDEPLFLLNARRRVLFVNRAWEALTGLAAARARGLACTRSRPAEPGPPEEVLRHVLCPPPEVLHGRPGHARRLVPAPDGSHRWWDVEFLPLRQHETLLAILGKVTAGPTQAGGDRVPLPEKIVALREAVARRFRLEELPARLPALRRAADQVRLAARNTLPVLVLGGPGTGKRWLARAVHSEGLTRELAFAALDCAALPAAALAAALFGPTGLARPRGVGTVYLRQPARLPRELQAKLADVLREAGGDGTDRVRYVAGSEAVEEAVQSGRLLEELYCSLSVQTILLPPLAERAEDLPWLAERFLERARAGEDGARKDLTEEAWDLLRAYSWPGNLREFHAVLRGAWQRAAGERIEAADLPAYLRLAVNLERTPSAPADGPLPLDPVLEQVERRLIVLALRRARGNKTRAAELLAIWRPRLLRRMEALGIADPETKEG